MDTKYEISIESKSSLVQQNMENYWELAAKNELCKVEFISSPDYVAVHSPSDNYVLSFNYTLKGGDNSLEVLHTSYTSRNTPYCFMVTSDENAQYIVEKLGSLGLKWVQKIEGMAANLDYTKLTYTLPNDVNIKTVESSSDFEDWITPQRENPASSDEGSDYKAIMEGTAKYSKALQHYVAYQNKKPVSSCSIFLDEKTKTVGVYNLATIPEARKQGIASCLVKHGLFRTQQAGFQDAVLQATKYSRNLFERIGFETCKEFELYYSS